MTFDLSNNVSERLRWMTSLILRLYSTEKCAKESGQEISSPQQRDGCNVFELLQEVEILPSFNEFQNFVVTATIEEQADIRRSSWLKTNNYE